MNRLFRKASNLSPPDGRAQTFRADLWVKCPECRELTYIRQLDDNAKICPWCGFHFHLSVPEWVSLLLDVQSFSDHAPSQMATRSLASQEYRHHADQHGEPGMARKDALCELVCGSGTIAALPLEVIVGDVGCLLDPVSTLYAEAFAGSVQRASERRVPLVTVITAGRTHDHRSHLSLVPGARILAELIRLGRAGQPHIAVLAGICCEEHCAAFIGHADVVVAEPGLRVKNSMSQPMATQIHKQPPKGYQGSDWTGNHLLARGLVDAIVHRAKLRQTLGGLLRIYSERAYSMSESIS